MNHECNTRSSYQQDACYCVRLQGFCVKKAEDTSGRESYELRALSCEPRANTRMLRSKRLKARSSKLVACIGSQLAASSSQLVVTVPSPHSISRAG